MDCAYEGWAFADTRASLENPTFSLNDPATLDEVWGIKGTAAGVKVGPLDALGYSPVWQAVSQISGKIAHLPLHVYKRKSDGSRESDRKHLAHKLVNRQFNDFPISAFRGWRMVMVQALLWNNAYVFIDRSESGPLGLYPLNPMMTKPALLNGRLVYETQGVRDNGVSYARLIEGRDVLHISGIEIMPDDPIELIKVARESFATGIAARNFTSRFFGNGVKPGGILMVPPGASQRYTDNLENMLSEGYTRENKWFKTVVLRDGVKFQKWDTTPADAEMTPTRDEQTREVARYFNMQPSRLGLQGSTSYNSKSEDNREFLETTLAPWMESITSECNLKLLTPLQVDRDTHYFEHNTRKFLQMDYKTRVQVGAMGTKAGLFTRNEWRSGENLPPIEGGDDVPDVGKSADMSGMQKGEDDKPRGLANDDLENNEEQKSIRRMVFEICSRARQKAADHRSYATWINSNYDAAVSIYKHGDDMKQEMKSAFISAMDSPLSELSTVIEEITTNFEETISHGA